MKKNIKTIIPKFKRRIICPVCSSRKIKFQSEYRIGKKALKNLNSLYGYEEAKIKLKLFSETKINICICESCNLTYHQFVPDEGTSNFIYNELIDEKLSYKKYKSREKLNRKNFNRLLNRLKNTIKNNSQENLNYLDFGFGWGGMLLASKYKNLIRMESSRIRNKLHE